MTLGVNSLMRIELGSSSVLIWILDSLQGAGWLCFCVTRVMGVVSGPCVSHRPSGYVMFVNTAAGLVSEVEDKCAGHLEVWAWKWL